MMGIEQKETKWDVLLRSDVSHHIMKRGNEKYECIGFQFLPQLRSYRLVTPSLQHERP